MWESTVSINETNIISKIFKAVYCAIRSPKSILWGGGEKSSEKFWSRLVLVNKYLTIGGHAEVYWFIDFLLILSVLLIFLLIFIDLIDFLYWRFCFFDSFGPFLDKSYFTSKTIPTRITCRTSRRKQRGVGGSQSCEEGIT